MTSPNYTAKVEPCAEGLRLTVEVEGNIFSGDDLMIERYVDDGTIIVTVGSGPSTQASITLNPELAAQLARFVQTGDIK